MTTSAAAVAAPTAAGVAAPAAAPAVPRVPAFNRPLRIGVMLDGPQVPRWVARVLEEIAATPFLRLSLVVFDGTENRPARSWRSWIRRQWQALPYRLWEWYQAADYRRFRDAEHDPFAVVDVTDTIDGAETLHVAPVRTRFVDRFADADLARMKAADLDVMLRFGFRIIKGGILGSARFGVWSLHHGDNRLYRGGPALFWEMYEGNAVSGTVLQVLSEQLDGGGVIYRSLASTQFGSLYKNRQPIYWKTSAFIVRRLSDLWWEGWDYLTQLDTYRETAAYRRGIYRRPTAGKMLWFLARTYAHRARAKFLEQFDERWVIAARRRGAEAIDAPFTILHPPAGRFYADPFVVEDGGRAYVLFEEYRERDRKGVISCVEIDRSGRFGTPAVVLERDCHLSYPFLFQWNGAWHMVPESGDGRTVDLYRSDAFPHQWRHVATLLSGVDARDATLVEWNGRWWMFVTLCMPGGPRADELSLFYADSPLGPWTPHPRNPIVSDVTRARSAGAIYVEDDALVRPAQDGSHGYGYAISLNRIDLLDEREYRESPVGVVRPTWHRRLLGTHTVNRSAHYEVTDGRFRWYRRRPSPAE
jgi:hypothetical protein